MAIEIVDFPIKTSIYKGFSMAMLNNQMVYHIPWFRMKPCVINSSCPSAKAKHAEWCRVGRWAVVILFQDLQNPKQAESESLYIECHANPNVTVHMLLCWCHVLGLVMTCIDPRAVQSWQMCVTKPMSLIENLKIRWETKSWLNMVDHHVMAVADWEQTMINIDQPRFCFSSEHCHR